MATETTGTTGTTETSGTTEEGRRPAALAWSTDNCSVGRLLAVVGEKWTFQVLREVFLGVRRFDDIHAHGGIPRQVLSKRLASLVGHGILRREPYREDGSRERHEYRLTAKGLELRTPLMGLMAWGDSHLADPQGPAVQVVHRGCGEPVRLHARCTGGHETPEAVDLQFVPGPGALRHPAG